MALVTTALPLSTWICHLRRASAVPLSGCSPPHQSRQSMRIKETRKHNLAMFVPDQTHADAVACNGSGRSGRAGSRMRVPRQVLGRCLAHAAAVWAR